MLFEWHTDLHFIRSQQARNENYGIQELKQLQITQDHDYIVQSKIQEMDISLRKVQHKAKALYFLMGGYRFVMQLSPWKWYGIDFGFFAMALVKVLVCGLK